MNKPPPTAFLSALSAQLQAVSQRVLRAILAFIVQFTRFAYNVLRSISDFIAQALEFGWHIYCRIEISIADTLAAILIILWSLRLLALLLAPIAVLAVLNYWTAALTYLAVIGLAVLRFYSAKHEDVAQAAASQAPVRAFLVGLFIWTTRGILLVLTVIGLALTYSSTSAESLAQVQDYWNRLYTSHNHASPSVEPTSASNTSLLEPRTPSTPSYVQQYGDRCKGSPEWDKCIEVERRLARETPEQRAKRQRELEALRKFNMDRVNRKD